MISKRAYLVLESGKIFDGISFGAEKETYGEVVFNTGMVGYPETLTDPSYNGQILVTTYPLIGNYGAPGKKYNHNLIETLESDKIQVSGLVVAQNIDNNSHWQSVEFLSAWLKRENIPAIFNIDTRSLTKIIREFGVMKGRINLKKPNKRLFFMPEKDNLVDEVSCKKIIEYGQGKINLLLIDCGVKVNIIRSLIKENVRVTQVPWNYNPFRLSDIRFDGIIISNGPGDPKNVIETIEVVKQAVKRRIPILGICLGNQILALAIGMDTYKLKYGHRGQNQPVKDLLTKHCYVTTQNHGYAVSDETIPHDWLPWFVNLNDSTNEGIRHKKLPFWGVQFHPEANPGPTDTVWILQHFISELKKWKERN